MARCPFRVGFLRYSNDPAGCLHPDALPDKEHVQEKMQATLRFFHSLNEGQSSVHAPGENLPQVRKRSMEQGIPVTEATWEKIVSIC